MCGIAGAYNHEHSSSLVYAMLGAEQNRGEEAAGIVSFNGRKMHSRRKIGAVEDVFRTTKFLEDLAGSTAIGQLRYSTDGSIDRTEDDIQPFYVNHGADRIAVAHNGNLYDAQLKRAEFERRGRYFQTSSDTEVILPLAFQVIQESFEEQIISALRQVRGSYSMLMMRNDDLIVARDPNGYRPLLLGNVGAAYVVASEKTALDRVQATDIREVEPGEMIVFSKRLSEPKHLTIMANAPRLNCVFEYIYFAGPGSTHLFGHDISVAEVRQDYGRQLFREHPVEADIVIPIPDSGRQAAIGFSKESGIQFDEPVIKNTKAPRTFILPEDQRDLSVQQKHFEVRGLLEGKRIVVVDDSIMRGNTTLKKIRTLRDAGAKEVHMRISSPPTIGACYFGIAIKNSGELIASKYFRGDDVRKDIGWITENVCRDIGADSLGYLSMDGLRENTPGGDGLCVSCFTRKYPELLEQMRSNGQVQL